MIRRHRNMLESLEPRQLLAGYSLDVNFQPSGTQYNVVGTHADIGAVFSWHLNNTRFGWDADNRANTRDRGASPSLDQRYDSLIHMQKNGNRTWEAAVPNGLYRVRVVAGDSDYFDSTFRINVEGVLTVDGKPISANRWVEGAKLVTITDGRVTITNAAGAVNNKLCYVEIDQVVPAFWQSAPSMPQDITEVGSAVIGNVMYVFGDVTAEVASFDLLTNTWRPMSAVSPRPFQGDHQSAQVVGGKLYLIGGLRTSAGKVQIYDPAKNLWTSGADIPWTGGSVSTCVINGKIYAAGGIVGSSLTNYQGTGDTNQAAVYDPATNVWTPIASLPIKRNHTAAGTDGKKFYIFGGRLGKNIVANGFNTVQIYDPATNTWKTSDDGVSGIKPMPTARGGMGNAVFYGGEFYIMGGETWNGPGATSLGVYAQVDIYNPLTNTWRRGPDMLTPRHGIFPVLYENRIYVAGGGPVHNESTCSILEILTLPPLL